MRGLKEIKVEWDVYNFKVWCVIGPHRYLPAYVKRRHRRVYKAKDADELGGMYFPSHSGVAGILWLAKRPRTPIQIGYLAHEMGHAVMDMHTYCAINLDTMNDETFCYALAHGVQTVLEECK